MRHGVLILPERRWPDARELWAFVEELGYDHAWMYDHYNWRWLREKPWFALIPTLAAAATATSTLRLGTLVASPGNRHPVAFAQDLMTLDDISGGRMICGIGAGAGGFDDEVLGQPTLTPRQRADRLEEFVELTDRLLTQPETSYQGAHFSTAEMHMHPGCVQRPRLPIGVAAIGPRGIRLAARHADIWITAAWPGHGDAYRYDKAIPVVAEQSALLDKECAAIGRDPATVRRLVATGARIGGVLDSVESYRDACGLFGEIGMTDLVVHWPRAEFPYQGSVAVLEDFAATELARRPAENQRPLTTAV